MVSLADIRNQVVDLVLASKKWCQIAHVVVWNSSYDGIIFILPDRYDRSDFLLFLASILNTVGSDHFRNHGDADVIYINKTTYHAAYLEIVGVSDPQ